MRCTRSCRYIGSVVAQHFAQTVFGPGSASRRKERGAHRSSIWTAPQKRAAPRCRRSASKTPRPSPSRSINCATLRTTAGSMRRGGADCTSCCGRLLPLVAQSRSSAATLVRVLKILEMIGGRTVYLALLNENATALAQAGRAVRAEPVSRRPDRGASAAARRADRRALDRGSRRRVRSSPRSWRCGSRNMQGEEPERQVELLREFQSAALVSRRRRRSDRRSAADEGQRPPHRYRGAASCRRRSSWRVRRSRRGTACRATPTPAALRTSRT